MKYGVLIFLILLIVGFVVASFTVLTKSSSSDGNDCGKTCPDGTKCYPEYDKSCLPCNPNQDDCGTCTVDTECKNDAKCKVYVQGKKGLCDCKDPYFGKDCSQVCTKDGNQCQNGGECLPNGTCKCPPNFTGPTCAKDTPPCKPDGTCTFPGCDYSAGCKCSDGWVDNPSDFPDRCTACAEGRGPNPTDCSKKLYHDKQLSLRCYYIDRADDPWIESKCKAAFGDKATYTGNHCGNDNCSFTDRQFQCQVPSYWANATGYDPGTFDSCIVTGKSGSVDGFPPGFVKITQ